MYNSDVYKLFFRMNKLYYSCFFFNKFEIKILTKEVSLELNFLFIIIFNWLLVNYFSFFSFKKYFSYREMCLKFFNDIEYKSLIFKFKDLWFDIDKYIHFNNKYIYIYFNKYILFIYKRYNVYNWLMIFKAFFFFICIKYYKWKLKLFFFNKKRIMHEKRRKKIYT